MADLPATSDEVSESGDVGFSKEEVDALLKEEPEAEEFNLKTKMEMTNHIKRLKLCIKWFQQVNENHNLDKVKLQSDLEAMHKKWFDAEMDMLDVADHLERKRTKLRKRYTKYKKKKRAEVADLKTSLAEQREAADMKVRTLEAKLTKYEETYGETHQRAAVNEERKRRG